MRFCVIGAGSGGRAFAAYISSKGYPVSLYNRSFSRIHEIKKKKGIVAKGELEGFFPINRVTQDIEFAIKDADVIMVVTPAFAHKSIAEKMAPYLSKDQIILLNPGRTFGSVEFMKVIEKKRRFSHNIVGETQTLLFTSRELPGNKVNILKIKNSVNYSTYPEIFTYFPYNSIKNVFRVSFDAIRSYINYLEESFIIFQISIFSYSLKVQEVNPKKIYCIDNGLRNAVSFKFSKDEGKLAENLVFLELKRQNKEIYYWQGKNEVDFVIKEIDGSLTAINVTYTDEIHQREIQGLKEFKDQYSDEVKR